MLPDEINAFLDLQLSQGLTRDAAVQKLIQLMMVERRMSATATTQALLAACVKERLAATA